MSNLKFNIMSQRSAAYPSSTLLESFDFSKKIYKSFGANYRATRAQIAEALGYSPNSVNIKISSASQYGLLDMVSKQGYQVTPLFVQWHRPIKEESEHEALVKAFKNPPLYQNLLQVFENDILPPLRPLASILLQNHNISEKACDKVAEIFEENAKIVSALSEDRLLSFNHSDFEVIEEEVIEVEEGQGRKDNERQVNYSPVVVQQANNNNSSQNRNDNQSQNINNKLDPKAIPHNIPLKNKLPAQLLLPSDIDSADFDFIIAYIGLIRNQY